MEVVILKILIRSYPLPGESLSSLIQRIAKLNFIDPHDIWRLLNIGKHYPQSSLSAPIDISPNSLIDLNYFAEQLDLSLEALEKLTFLPVFQKFGIDMEDCSSSRILSNEVERYRKYCPECLKSSKMYKLIWQVCSINFCHIHNISLMNRCPNCNNRIPILPSKSDIGICPYCNTLFSDYTNESYSTQPDDLKRLEDWKYILDYEKKGLSNVEAYSPKRSVAIKTIYLSDKMKDMTRGDQLRLTPIKQTARDSQCFKKNVHLESVFYFINKSGITMEDFLLMEVPKDFTEKLLTISKKQTEKYSCIAPWCQNYKIPGSLVRKPTSVKTLKSGVKLKYYMYCNNCGTEYCLDSDGTIVERGTLIDFAWAHVRECIIHYWSVHGIITKYNTTEDKVRRAAIFLAANNLLEPAVIPYKIPLSHDLETKSKIKDLIQMGTTMKQIKTKLRMNYNDFLFYWLCSEIKVSYLGSSKPIPNKTTPKDLHNKEFVIAINKLLSNNIDITIQSVCNELNVVHETLRYWGMLDDVKRYKLQQKELRDKEFTKEIINKTDKLIASLNESKAKINSEEFYKQLGIRRTVLVRHHPELTKYIQDKLRLATYN